MRDTNDSHSNFQASSSTLNRILDKYTILKMREHIGQLYHQLFNLRRVNIFLINVHQKLLMKIKEFGRQIKQKPCCETLLYIRRTGTLVLILHST
jgi:hypothetical protein